MEINQITAILSTAGSACIGAFLGGLRSKLLATKGKSSLQIGFYIFSAVVFVGSIFCFLYCREEFLSPNWYGILTLVFSLASSIILFYFTRYYMVPKNIYKTTELSPIINKFTTLADKNEIMLFGGDLNFFGNSSSEIDKNSQYTHLKSLNFNKISILCEAPNDSSKKLRYGKLLFEVPAIELRFYNPAKADLRVRGRIIKVDGVPKLLMYTKSAQDHYQALETDIANSNGALYNNIWELIWSMATQPSQNDINSYKNLYQNK